MSVPELSHQQIAVLNALGPKELSGRELREALKVAGVSKSGALFYQMMSRLEDSNFVNGSYETKSVDGQSVRERRYTLTGEGDQALRAARGYYEQVFGKYGIA